MRRLLCVLFLSIGACLFCAHPLQAQTTGIKPPDHDKQFYLFASPNAVNRPNKQAVALAIGGGVEQFLGQHAIFGFELAESIVQSDFSNTPKSVSSGGNIVWVALTGGYQFKEKDDANRTKPFISAGCGISGINGAGLGTQINYGGGFNRWSTKHIGFRVEVRRFIHSGDSEGRITGLRIGLVIR